MKIGIVGFGGVGKALIKLLHNKKEFLSKKQIEVEVKFVLNSKSGIYNKDGIDLDSLVKFNQTGKDISDYPNGVLKNIDYTNLLEDTKVDYLIEITPTNVETGEPGLSYIRQALRNKIHVVTANKGPILLAYEELKNLAAQNNVKLGIGCTCGGALPAVSGGLINMAGAEILSIEGILNGTTNFILECMDKENLSYEEALRIAQNMGIAETNPRLDVEGWDTAIKLVILTNVLMDEHKTLEDVYVEGITNIAIEQVKKARKKGEKYKLIAKAFNKYGNIVMKVEPERIDSSHVFYNVDGKNKAILYRSNTLGNITIMGGASDVNAAAASILRDIVNIHNSII